MRTCLYAIMAFCLSGIATAQDDDFHTLMMRATVKLKHDKSTAAGFVLRQDRPSDKGGPRSVLVTAAHVFDKSPDSETSLIYRSRQPDGGYKKETAPLAIRKDGQPLWTRHPSEDVATIAITLPDNADVPVVSTNLLANDELLRQQRIHPGLMVTLLGYPHRTEANDAGFPILRTGSISSFPLIPAAANKTFLLGSNTFEGDSGGPVFVAETGREGDAKPLILGLMHGQRFIDEEMSMIYGSSKVRHRLGLGIVVQAEFIRQTLEKMP